MIDARPQKVEWYGEIKNEFLKGRGNIMNMPNKWLTFAKTAQYGYEYSDDLKKITATTDDNEYMPFDKIEITADFNSYYFQRIADILFTQKDSNKQCTVHIVQDPHRIIIDPNENPNNKPIGK